VPQSLIATHRSTLDNALNAIASRGYWSAYPEVPSGKIYGETARDEQLATFQARLNGPFTIEGQPSHGTVGDEVSPYGMKLGVAYPRVQLDTLFAAANRAMKIWQASDIETRTGVCLEILHRLNRRSFELAFAVMHTTGQGFMMAFQAGGPHAQDRGLEAVAYAYDEMRRVPQTVQWQKQVSKTEAVRLEKRFRIVPRGIAVVIGCSTFPTWNGYPGLFASLVTGNAVVVKPHPGAILALAITVEVARDVLREQGFDPNVITLAADTAAAPLTRELVVRPEVKIIDYTGSSAFGEWIEKNASGQGTAVFTEKAGVNSVIIDSVDDLKAMANNLAFTLSLYSGQMCTTSQNIFIPRGGITAGAEHKSFDEVAHALVDALNGLLGEPKRAAEILGAIQNDATLKRVDDAARDGGEILRPSQPVQNDQFPQARSRSPLLIKTDATQHKLFMREMFGPISYLIATANTDQSIELARQSACELGAITWSAYSTSPTVLEAIDEAALEAGVPLSCNLTGQIYVNQAAAFSDYHVSGCNPSGNATLTDAAFVAPRFRVVQMRVPAATNIGIDQPRAVIQTTT
jgi:phenylacetic acid degradation protein paaN